MGIWQPKYTMQYHYIQEMSRSGPLTIRVNGQCMADSLPDGSDVTIVRRVLYWPGDIVILGRGDGQLLSHRILGYVVGRRGWRAVTMADTESKPDAPVPLNRILGKAVMVNGESLQVQTWQRLLSFIALFRVMPGLILTSLRASG
jgi:hypothetical protein